LIESNGEISFWSLFQEVVSRSQPERNCYVLAVLLALFTEATIIDF
jgi:hypothetical protein